MQFCSMSLRKERVFFLQRISMHVKTKQTHSRVHGQWHWVLWWLSVNDVLIYSCCMAESVQLQKQISCAPSKENQCTWYIYSAVVHWSSWYGRSWNIISIDTIEVNLVTSLKNSIQTNNSIPKVFGHSTYMYNAENLSSERPICTHFVGSLEDW